MPYICEDAADCNLLRDTLLPPTLAQLLAQYRPPQQQHEVNERQSDATEPQPRVRREADLSESGTLLLRLLHDTSAESEAWLRHFLLNTTKSTYNYCVVDNVNGGCEYAQTQSAHDALWFLLVYYSEDASSCLAYAHGLMRYLIRLKHHPPPDIHTLHTLSCESEERRRREGGHNGCCCQCCCPCGCVRRGVVMDRTRYRFHRGYYQDHHITGSNAQSTKSSEEIRNEDDTKSETLHEDEVADTQLLPLPVLALQTLANFVLAICGKYYQPNTKDVTTTSTSEGNNAAFNTLQTRRLMTYEVFFTPAQRALVVLACTLLAWKQLDVNGVAHMLIPSKAMPSTLSSHYVYEGSGTDDNDAEDEDEERHARETFWNGNGGALEALACLFYNNNNNTTNHNDQRERDSTTTTTVTGDEAHNSIDDADHAMPHQVIHSHVVQPTYRVADICVMEGFVFRTLDGQVGQLPLWWRVAMEVMRLYYDEALLEGVRAYNKFTSEVHAEGILHQGDDEQSPQQQQQQRSSSIPYRNRLQRVRVAFRAHLEQLSLRCMDLLLLPALLLDAEAVHTSQQATNTQQDNITGTTSTTTNTMLETIYAYMGHHALLGAALAIEAGAVPFSFLSAMLFVMPPSSTSTSLCAKSMQGIKKGDKDAKEVTLPQLGAATLHALLAELTRWRHAGQAAMATLERSAQRTL